MQSRTGKPQRTRSNTHVLLLCASASFLSYCDRVNMSVGVVNMASDLGWTIAQRGTVLGAFFYGYIVTQLLGAVLAQRFGPKRVLGTAVLVWSALTLLTPLAASAAFPALVVVRVLLGLFEGVTFPVLHHMVNGWVAPTERSRAIAAIYSGSTAGTVAAFLICPPLNATFGWPSSFYLFGTLGVVWFLVWQAMAKDPPGQAALVPDSGASPKAARPPPTMKASLALVAALLTTPSALAMFLAHFANNVGHYVLLAWLPTLLERVWHVDAAHVYTSCLPYVAMGVAVQVWSAVADSCITRGATKTRVRKALTATGFLGSSVVLVVVATYMYDLTAMAGMGLLCVAMGLQTANQSGYEASKLEIAHPRHTGLVSSVSNTLATLAGVVGVPLVSLIVDLTGDWSAVLVVIALVYTAGAAVYVWLGTAELIFT